MIRLLDLREGAIDARAALPRAAQDIDSAARTVREVLDDVRDRGETAIAEWSQRFDGITPPSLRVPAQVLRQASEGLDPRVRAALAEAIRRVRLVHADQRRVDVTTIVEPGATVTERWIPVDRVGLYVPGGRAVYPSSVVMNVVPAQIAGVRSIAVASPPQRDHGGWPHPVILAACAMLGVDEVYAVGGAQAVGLFGYGSDLTAAGGGASRCEPVTMVTGPGNIWVTAAKRALKGRIGIDAEAGPTEIAILADDTADPVMVAADLISQAEHDVVAASVLVTTSVRLADAVQAELAAQVAVTKHAERITEALAGPQSGILLVRDLDQGLAIVNAYAAEHLEIHTAQPREVARRVRNAGAIFVGSATPVSLGDYCAGSNHVLPTGGSARHSSGLSVQTFLRGVHIVEYDERALLEVADQVTALAQAEDLPAHAAAIEARRR